PDGDPMTDEDWDSGYAKSLGVFLNGHAIPDLDRHGREVRDDSFYLLFNAWEQPIDFTLPGPGWSTTWKVVLDTGEDLPPQPGIEYKAGDTLALGGRVLVVLSRT
ncbi:MAG TPA: hypothetical protein VKQ71_12195, partial [Acidimicrobiales bacterium]|nr:hypothetical protein [Acidimicrobiales bacterium]